VQSQKGFLAGVVGVAAVAETSEEKVKDQALVAAVKMVERSKVGRLVEGEQFLVRQQAIVQMRPLSGSSIK
jgi:hypothetical protein